MKLLLKSPVILASLTALLAAIFFSLAFPGGSVPYLALFAFVPLFLLLPHVSVKINTWAWSFAGFLMWVFATYWLYHYVRYILEVNRVLTVLLCLFFWTISAIPCGLAGFIFSRFSLFSSKKGALLCAAIFTALIGLMPVPFPGDISMSFYRTPFVLQVIDLGGGFLLHFIILAINAFIAQILLLLFRKQSIPQSQWLSLAAFLILPLLYGVIRLHQFDKQTRQAPPSAWAQVAYIQSNIPGQESMLETFGPFMPEEEWENSYQHTFDMTYQAARNYPGIDFFIWPETPQDFCCENDQTRSAIEKIVQLAQAPLFFSAMKPWSGSDDLLYFTGSNTIYRIDNDMTISHPYAKANLIPFSEYIPLESQFPWLRKYLKYVGGITPGKQREVIPVGKKIKIIPLICYDGIFPDFVRHFAKKGGNVMMTLDSDTNFGPTRAAEVHFSVEIFRVLEHRIPLLRVANCGPSCLVHASGVIDPKSETQPFRKDFRVVSFLPSYEQKTFYQRAGFTFPWILAVLSSLVVWRQSKKAKGPPSF